MTKLRLGPLADDKPVKVTVEMPATVYRDLVAYAEALARENLQPNIEPAKLVAPMLAHFMAADRAFRTARRSGQTRQSAASGPVTKPPTAPAAATMPAHPPRDELQEPRPANPAQSPSPFFKLATSGLPLAPHRLNAPTSGDEEFSQARFIAPDEPASRASSRARRRHNKDPFHRRPLPAQALDADIGVSLHGLRDATRSPVPIMAEPAARFINLTRPGVRKNPRARTPATA